MNPFDGDAAADWVYDLEGADDLALVRDALEEAVEVHGYLDAGEGARALAAAEVIAAANGRPLAAGLPEALAAWLEAVEPKVTDDDLDLARRAVRRITGPRSELAESATDDLRATVDDLLSRLP